MRKIKAFTMRPHDADAVLIGLWQDGRKVAVTARIKDARGILLPEDTVDPVFRAHPLTALAVMLNEVAQIGAKCCGVFTNSEVLLHWFFIYRMRCPLKQSDRVMKTRFRYDSQPMTFSPPEVSNHPAWDIARIMLGYQRAGVWQVSKLNRTKKIWLDHYGESC